MVDSHAHLNHPDFAADLDAVVARAGEAGVTTLLVVGYDLESSRLALALCRRYPGLACAVGISPHEADTFSQDALVALRELAREPEVAAIGEIGLDFHWKTHPPELQLEVFSPQLTLAAELSLPVVVHCREAFPEVLTELSRYPGPAAVLHCFSGTAQDAGEALALGCYLGIAGNVTFKSARELQELASGLPLTQVLVETDCPYLAPQPRRGQRNQPAYLPYVVEKLAQLWLLPTAEVAQVTAANARRALPRLPAPPP